MRMTILRVVQCRSDQHCTVVGETMPIHVLLQSKCYANGHERTSFCNCAALRRKCDRFLAHKSTSTVWRVAVKFVWIALGKACV